MQSPRNKSRLSTICENSAGDFTIGNMGGMSGIGNNGMFNTGCNGGIGSLRCEEENGMKERPYTQMVFTPPSVDERIALDSMDKEICTQKSKIRSLEDELLVVMNEMEIMRSKMCVLVSDSGNLRVELEELRAVNLRNKCAVNSFCADLEKCSTFITTMIQRVQIIVNSN